MSSSFTNPLTAPATVMTEDLARIAEALSRSVDILASMRRSYDILSHSKSSYQLQQHLQQLQHQFEQSLNVAKAITNSSSFQSSEPQAKIYLMSVFAALHQLAGAGSEEARDWDQDGDSDSDKLYHHFCFCMEALYGPTHVVMSDCFTLVAAARAAGGRLAEATEVSRSVGRLVVWSCGCITDILYSDVPL